MQQILHYKDDGLLSYAEYRNKTGVPLLVQHGLIASISDHHLFDRLLDSGNRLICIARPGYGESSPYLMQNLAEWGDIVSSLVEKLKISKFDVLGMSSGAPYSYAIGYKLPDQVRNIFIFSGIPALYNENILSHWPYEVTKNASMVEMEELAYELFFSHLSKEDLERRHIKDSMQNRCFGIAQDFKLRCIDWGFQLSEVKENVHMQHSRMDREVPFLTAERTAKLLPNCQLEIREQGEHFSQEALDNFMNGMLAKMF